MKDKSRQLFYPYGMVLLFTLLNGAKLVIMHLMMGIKDHFGLITVLNTLSLTAIFLLVNLAKENRRNRLFMVSHGILAILFFANTMYFSHFSTLMPVRIFYQIRHLTGVSNSVGALLKIKYVLFFADLPFLWRYFKRRPMENIKIGTLHRTLSLGMVLLLVITAWQSNLSFHRREAGYYTPFNLGMLNYHFYDMLSLVTTVEAQPIEEEMLEAILEEEVPEQRAYSGIGAGRNLIVIQAESLQSFVLNRQVEGQWITPVLNSLIAENSLYFGRYYEQVGWGNTSDAEFVSQTGLHASTKNYSYKEYESKDLVALPKLLKRQGYGTAVFHGNEESFWNRNAIYPNLGIDNYISKEDLAEDEVIGMGISDHSLFRQAIEEIKSAQQPFYASLITLTSHYPYTIAEENQGLQLSEEYEGTVVGNYFQTVNYLDRGIGELIEGLKREGLYDNTMIVIYGDHHGIKIHDEESTDQIESFLGEAYREEIMLNVPLIIHVPESDLEAREITTVGGQVDFLPTVGNLMGLDLSPYTLVGKDLLNTEDDFALVKLHTAKGSFIDGDIIFIMAQDGIYENSQAWNMRTGEPVELEECREGYERALAEIQISEQLLEALPEAQE